MTPRPAVEAVAAEPGPTLERLDSRASDIAPLERLDSAASVATSAGDYTPGEKAHSAEPAVDEFHALYSN